MADKILTQAAYDTDNIQSEADQVKGQATALKVTFDKTGNDAKIYNNTGLLVELQSQTLNSSGAHAIGLNTPDTVATNVADELVLIRQAGSGALPPDDSITLAKQNSTVKTGLVADLDTTVKTDLVSAINEDVTNLDILRLAKLDTGAANAYVVTTVGTFNRVDGNTLPFTPANNNTGASTINEDTNGVANIKKYVDGAWIALEEGDLKKFQQVQLVWNASESVFQFSPKGGAVIKSIQRGTVNPSSNTTDVTISEVDLTIAIPRLTIKAAGNAGIAVDEVMARIEFLNDTTIRITMTSYNGAFIPTFFWEVIEFNNVKSIQSGYVSSGNNASVSVSAIDENKSIIYSSASSFATGLTPYACFYKAIIESSTNIKLEGWSNPNVQWYLIEFN